MVAAGNVFIVITAADEVVDTPVLSIALAVML
jgi:hypothetical protein